MISDPSKLEAWRKHNQAILADIHLANQDAIRAHRATGVPMVIWQDGAIRHVSPFDIPLPGEPGWSDADPIPDAPAP